MNMKIIMFGLIMALILVNKSVWSKTTVEVSDETLNRVDLSYPDKRKVRSTGIPKKLKLSATKKWIANPDFTQSQFGNNQIAQGTEIWAELLDENGNSTNNCIPAQNKSDGATICTPDNDINVVIQDRNSVVSGAALNLYIPANSSGGKTIARAGNAILGDENGEIIQVGVASLIATAFDSSGKPIASIADSEPLEIVVMSTSLAVEVHPDFMEAQQAGNEFNAFAVYLINNAGQLHVDTSNTPISPGELVIKNLQTSETIIVNPIDNLVKARFLQQTKGNNQYLISDSEGSYAQMLVKASAILPAINIPPTAAFTVSPSNGEAPLIINLDASASTDDGTITQYNWSASDGQTASGKNVAMTFPNAGTYIINLVVTDDKNTQRNAQKTITVTPKPVPKIPPVTTLIVSPKNGSAPLTVNLDGSQSTDSDGNIIEHAWTASDGQQTSGGNQQITFANIGTYTIALTVTDNDGLTATAQDTVTVIKPIEPTTGQAIIIAAGGAQPDNTLFKYSNDFVQRMYRLLKDGGFSDTAIHYMNPYAPDIDVNGYPDDGQLDENRRDYPLFAPAQELPQAFANAASNLKAGQQFVFYLHGHAEQDEFLITPTYSLSASTLRDLLATLPTGVTQIIILDSCYSGSFFDELKGVADRILISSTDAQTFTWNTKHASFTDKFLLQLRRDNNLWDAFLAAESMIINNPQLFKEQRPWLDDDGDGIYSVNRDGTRAAQIYLGCPSGQECTRGAPPPMINRVHPRIVLDENVATTTLWLETITQREKIRKVQAILVNPEFADNDYRGFETDFGRIELELLYSPPQKRYEVVYDGFCTAGIWQVLYQLQNVSGIWSDIVQGEVQAQGCTLPATVKMLLNQSSYTTGDPLRLDMVVNGEAKVDLYVAIVFPDGDFITIAYPLNFSWPNAAQVYQPNVEIAGQQTYPIMSLPLPGGIALGQYSACGVLVKAGAAPLEQSNWIHIDCASFTVH